MPGGPLVRRCNPVASQDRECAEGSWCFMSVRLSRLGLQALARGFLARCELRRRVAERQAVEGAALAVIAPWARTAVDRLRFLRLR